MDNNNKLKNDIKNIKKIPKEKKNIMIKIKERILEVMMKRKLEAIKKKKNNTINITNHNNNRVQEPLKNDGILILEKNKYKIKKNKFAIMAIFKNEEEYMEEWLNHHIEQGVDKFYLYCNDSEKKKYNYLNNYEYEKKIILIDWTDKQNKGRNTIQRQAYLDCIQKYGHEYHYIMMLDLDEFIININKNNTVIDYLNSLKISETKAIKIPRYDFGSNGHINKPEGKVMDNYKKHEEIYSSFKTIANSIYINKKKFFYSVHDFNYLDRKGIIYNSFLSKKNPINKNKRGNKNETPLIINHYNTKSHEEYFKRVKIWENGGVNPFQYRKNCEEEFKKRDINEIEGYDYITQ